MIMAFGVLGFIIGGGLFFIFDYRSHKRRLKEQLRACQRRHI